jgi:outer membrane protein TolC
MNKTFFRYILWANILLLWSCKAPQIAQNNALKPLPETFGAGKDTANSATMNWKQFFQDSTLVGLIQEGLRNNLDLQMTMKNL